LVEDLNAVVPYDWARFLHERIDNINPHADFAGIERGGYKLDFQDKPTKTERAYRGALGPEYAGPDCWYSIGLRIDGKGNIQDVRLGGPADKARLAPGEMILAADGKVFSADALRGAIRTAKGAGEPIHLIVQADSFVNLIDIDYHDGERYPVLQRVEGTPDTLDEITKPLTTPEKAPAEPKKDDE
jgi:predicted metalloprotease with PDZ domain